MSHDFIHTWEIASLFESREIASSMFESTNKSLTATTKLDIAIPVGLMGAACVSGSAPSFSLIVQMEQNTQSSSFDSSSHELLHDSERSIRIRIRQLFKDSERSITEKIRENLQEVEKSITAQVGRHFRDSENAIENQLVELLSVQKLSIRPRPISNADSNSVNLSNNVHSAYLQQPELLLQDWQIQWDR